MSGRVAGAAAAWLDPRALARAARVRLFTFPFAGGGAAVFRPWSVALPPEIAVCPVRLPGRESRIAEPAATDLVALAHAAAGALRPHLAVPYALFGHSMGALVAFEVARHLQASGAPAPRILYASGCPAPHIGEADVVSGLSDRDLVEHVRALGGTSAAVLASPELLELLLPALRADLVACERYAWTAGAPLGCRLIAIGGAADDQASPEALAAWREHTRGPFEARVLTGGHFDFLAQPAALLAGLRSDLCEEAR